jgi:hypothetical protein
MAPQNVQSAGGFTVGDMVLCVDDHDGSHFLLKGQCYAVDTITVDETGRVRVSVIGMAKMWDPERFRRMV